MSTPVAPAASSSKRRPILIVAVLVLVLGGGGAWWWRQRAATAHAAAPGAEHGATEKKAQAAERSLLDLESFTVNLADPGVARFLRTSVQLVIAADEGTVKGLEHEKLPMARVRSAILDLLSEQTSSALATPDGKSALKSAIAAKATDALGHEVTDVLFSDFVIQY